MKILVVDDELNIRKGIQMINLAIAGAGSRRCGGMEAEVAKPEINLPK